MSAYRGGRGYLVAALNTDRVDYLRMAYCLALSIRATQRRVSGISVLVAEGQPVDGRYARAFDEVVVLSAAEEVVHDPQWRVGSVPRLYDLTPYEETVFLDADTLLFDDVSHWWDEMSVGDIALATATTYRGEAIPHNPLRESFQEIGLPDLHNGFMYFRKGQVAAQVFDTIGRLARDWRATAERHFGRWVHFSGDCVTLLALRETGLEQTCRDRAERGVPRFVHMKACLQGWPHVPPTARDWRPWARYSFDDALRLTVDGVVIGNPFHYHVRDFVTDDLLERYERLALEVTS